MYVVKYSENLSYYTLVIGISYNFSEKKAFNKNNLQYTCIQFNLHEKWIVFICYCQSIHTLL